MNKCLLLLASLISYAPLFAQENQESDTLTIERHKGKITYLRFNANTRNNRKLSDEGVILKKVLELSDNDQLKLIRSREVDGAIHNKYNQYYKNVRVESAQYVTHSVSGSMESMNGSMITIPEMNVTSSVSESQAMDVALKAVNAKKYAWEDSSFSSNARAVGLDTSLEPKGELVICTPESGITNSPVLAWKFFISAAEPLSSDFVYVNAQTGRTHKKDFADLPHQCSGYRSDQICRNPQHYRGFYRNQLPVVRKQEWNDYQNHEPRRRYDTNRLYR